MAIWKSYRISEAITEIENNKFVLPVIQRRLVWDEEKMELLFDTLLKGDSFGGIMVIEEEKGTKPLFNYRYFTKDGSFIPSREIHTLNRQQFFHIFFALLCEIIIFPSIIQNWFNDFFFESSLLYHFSNIQNFYALFRKCMY